MTVPLRRFPLRSRDDRLVRIGVPVRATSSLAEIDAVVDDLLDGGGRPSAIAVRPTDTALIEEAGQRSPALTTCTAHEQLVDDGGRDRIALEPLVGTTAVAGRDAGGDMDAAFDGGSLSLFPTLSALLELP